MITTTKGIRAFFRRTLNTGTISYEKILALFFPLLAENAFTVGFSLINSAIISGDGMSVLSAVNLVDNYTTVIYTFIQGIATGTAILVSQYKGAKNDTMLRKTAATGISSVLIFSSFLTFLSVVFRQGILRTLFGGAAEDVMGYAETYMLWSCISLPLYAYLMAELSVVRGMGEGKVALYISVTNAVLYLALTILFISVLKLSITGLILAINCTRVIMAIVVSVVKKIMRSEFRYPFREYIQLNWKLVKRIFTFGFPVAVENLLFNGGKLIIQVIIVPLGTNAVATYSIAMNIMNLVQIPNCALSTTTMTVSGMCMGAGRPDEVRSFFKGAFTANTLIYVLFSALSLIFFRPLVGCFHPESDMVQTIFWCVLITNLAHVISHSASFLTANALRATGDVAVTTAISVTSMWVFRVLMAYILGIVIGWGIIGVFVAMAMDWSFRAIVFPIRFRRGKWEKRKVV